MKYVILILKKKKKKFINSIYKFKAYNVFLNQSIGKGILYLLLLCICLSAISSLFVTISLKSFADEWIATVNDNVPDFQLNNS